ncbi:MAG: hypothetical protein WCC59_17590 [Terriglobales bacterium]
MDRDIIARVQLCNQILCQSDFAIIRARTQHPGKSLLAIEVSVFGGNGSAQPREIA